jgi:hypothetical protein
LTGVAALRKFVPSRSSAERCTSCGAPLPGVHVHQFDPATRSIRCACERCSGIVTTWKMIPRSVRTLPGFSMTDAQWDDLMIPISLAFFSYMTHAGRVAAFYPGPAGAIESMIRLSTWKEIADANPELLLMQPDVEALLANRIGSAREYFIVPIDECYKLVGLIRIHWRGLSGGALVWGEIAGFFDALRRRNAPCPG